MTITIIMRQSITRCTCSQQDHMLSNNATSYPFLFGSAWTIFNIAMTYNLKWCEVVLYTNRVILLWTNAPSYALAHNYCYCHAYLSSSRFNFCLLWCHLMQKKIRKITRTQVGLSSVMKYVLKNNINKYMIHF